MNTGPQVMAELMSGLVDHPNGSAFGAFSAMVPFVTTLVAARSTSRPWSVMRAVFAAKDT